MYKILVVDNDSDTLETISLSLGSGGYEVIKAEGGQKAIMLVQKVPIDLILLDIMMPEIDGIQVCKILAANKETAKIPIIFISALPVESRNFKEAMAETKDLPNFKGAIEKPFQLEVLLKKIAKTLR